MGWIREMMQGAEPPISSFGRLASLCLESKRWPPEHRPKHRSLSTLFSKLDRGIDLDWLRDRGEVQEALAEILGRPLADLREAIGETRHEGDERFLRLRDVRYARQIDLAKETLPPGLPRLASEPPSWNLSWWLAPSGSGRTLTARWLKARGLAHVTVIQQRRDLFRLPPRGPLFIEIEEGLSRDQLLLSDEEMSSLRFCERPVCFAAPFASLHKDFEEFSSPDALSYLPELVDWVDSHLDGRGHFAPEPSEHWIRRVLLTANPRPTFGELLGLLGMLDEVPPRSLSAKSLEEVAAHFVKSRIRETSEKQGLNPRLADEAFSALCECTARLLADGESSRETARDANEWTTLLSSSANQEVPDADWFTTALGGSLGAQITKRDLRRASRRLPPAAFELTRALKSAGLLHEPKGGESGQGEPVLKLGPRWLASVLFSLASLHVTRLSAGVWGRVLLAKDRADDLCEALLGAARRGDLSAIFSLLDDEEEPCIEVDAAVEASIIVCGLVSLQGGDLPDELTEGLLELSAERILLVQGVPEPRLAPTDGSGLFRRDVFLLALLELCRRVPYPRQRLDPIRSDSFHLVQHFDRALVTLLNRRSLPQTVRSRALDLLLGLGAEPPAEGEGQRPGTVRFLKIGSTSAFQDALKECPVDILLLTMTTSDHTEVRKSETRACSLLWKILGSDLDPGRFFEDDATERKFWEQMPLPVLQRRLTLKQRVPFELLLPHQYAELFGTQGTEFLPKEGVRHCPIEAGLRVLRERGPSAFDPSSLSVLLGRAEGRCFGYINELVDKERFDDLKALLDATPPSLSAPLSQSLPETARLLGGPSAVLELVRSYLLSAIRQRHPRFRDCYERLVEIEAGVGALKHLS